MIKLLLLFFSFTALDFVPVCHEGRFCPYGVIDKPLEEVKCLPTKEGPWLSLASPKSNYSLQYPTPALQDAYEKKEYEKLAALLTEGYRAIEKTPYQKTAQKSYYYPSLFKLKTELYLSKIPLLLFASIGYLLALLFSKKRKLALTLFITAFFLHTVALGLRIYILGRPPVTTMTETLLYVPWISSLLALFFYKKEHLLTAASGLGFLLLAFVPAQIPYSLASAVLNSNYWLTVHVLMVVGSYGFFLLAGFLAHLYLFTKKPPCSLLLALTYMGTALLIVGTLLGGVWAQQSWGRFWDWDPKETWAFISSGFYIALIHAYRYKKITANGLAKGVIIGLLLITFTWYGVNYILATGLHSYGFGGGGERYYFAYLGCEILFLLYKNGRVENNLLQFLRNKKNGC